MPRLSAAKSLPWALLLQAGAVINEHWTAISVTDRNKLSRLMKKSKGNPGNLTAKDRAEIRRILGKIDVRALGQDLIPFARGARGRKR